MRDFLHRYQIGGAPAGAGAMGIARPSSRRVRRWHPELDSDVVPDRALAPVHADAAVDFVDMSAVVDRIHAAFFHDGR